MENFDNLNLFKAYIILILYEKENIERQFLIIIENVILNKCFDDKKISDLLLVIY